MKIIKTALCLLLAAVTAVSSLVIGVSASDRTALDGEIVRSVRELYGSASLSRYVLGSSSPYGVQEFTAVDFDPRSDGLRLDAVPAGEYADDTASLSRIAGAFASQGERQILCAVNGDRYTSSTTHARVLGEGTSYAGYSDPVVSHALTAPRGYTVYGGEIVCSGSIEQETPYNGSTLSFAIAADGTPLIGEITVTASIADIRSGATEYTDAVNRLPANDALVIYTDAGFASNGALTDAYEIVLGTDGDYALVPGGTVEALVEQIVLPGEARPAMMPGRIILCARGSAMTKLAGIEIGDEIVIGTDIEDALGNTELWRTVDSAVGGYMPLVRDGEIADLSDGFVYPATAVGIREDKTVTLLTSYGRQSGYSIGFTPAQLGALCRALGIKDAIVLDGGASAEMIAAGVDGGLELTGRPCDGYEVPSVNALILSADAGDLTYEKITAAELYDASALPRIAMNAKDAGYSLSLLESDREDPAKRLGCLGADRGSVGHAAAYQPALRSVSSSVAMDDYKPINNLFKQIEFDSTGEWLTVQVRESDVEAWYGKIF